MRVQSRFSGVLGQLPPILAWGVAEQPLQVGQSSTTGFWSGKTSSDASMQIDKGLRPLHDLGQRRFPINRCGMLKHDLLL
jgi:hypothetical protein